MDKPHIQPARGRPRSVLFALAASLGLPLSGAAQPKAVSSPQDKDRAALASIQAAFEDAASRKDFELLRPYLDKDFRGRMVSDEEVRGAAGLEAFWKRVGGASTEHGVHRYSIKLNPGDLAVSGDSAVARGRTDEKIEIRPGQPVEFHSDWEVLLRKDASGQWKLASMESRIDPVDKVSLGLKLAAQRFLNSGVVKAAEFAVARLSLPAFKLDREQDFDGDGIVSRERFADEVKPEAAPASAKRQATTN